MSHQQPMPKFNRPPVVEVALAVQFEALPLGGVHLGAFWETIRDRFPTVQEQPPLAPMREEFAPSSGPSFNFQVLGGPPTPRYWFLGGDESRLVQVQQDRFVYNWRRRDEASPYPDYESIRGEFDALFGAFSGFVSDRLSAAIRTDWAEVLYVNLIAPAGPWDHRQIGRVLRPLAAWDRDFLPDPEDVYARWRFQIPGFSERPVGRLHIEASPDFSLPRMEPILRLTLTARGQGEEAGGLAFLDVGHEWIVRGFADVTTTEMHTEWERTQ